MYCCVAQPWITVRGGSSISSITQSENAWLDLSPYQDLVAWLQVSELTNGSGTVSMAFQTAPTKDDSLFVAVTAAATVATGVAITTMLKDTTTNPLSRWLRWQLTVSGASSAWDATFRLLLSANVVGRAGRAKASMATRAPVAPSVASVASLPGLSDLDTGVPSTPLHLQNNAAFNYGVAVPTTYKQRSQPQQYPTKTISSGATGAGKTPSTHG
jgi:hypothetical protein